MKDQKDKQTGDLLAPGLFRALKRGERKRSKLDVTYDYGDGKRIEFSGPEPLGADDLRILQLRLFLEPKWEAVTADAMVVKGSYRALAKEIGAEVDSGGALKHIQDCIERLWKVSIIAQNGRKRQGFRLLSEYASDEADGRLYVALNPLIAQAVMGGGTVKFTEARMRSKDAPLSGPSGTGRKRFSINLPTQEGMIFSTAREAFRA